MSAASRAREKARAAEMAEKAAKELYDYLPEPTDPPTEVEADLAPLLAWWCREHRQVADELGYLSATVTDEGTFVRRKPVKISPALGAALTIIGGLPQ